MGREVGHARGRRRGLSVAEGRARGRATRLIHAGQAKGGRTVGPAVERGSTVILPSAAALYDEGSVTYGPSGLGVQGLLAEAPGQLEGAHQVSLFPPGLAALTAAMRPALQ